DDQRKLVGADVAVEAFRREIEGLGRDKRRSALAAFGAGVQPVAAHAIGRAAILTNDVQGFAHVRFAPNVPNAAACTTTPTGMNSHVRAIDGDSSTRQCVLSR